MFLAYIIMHKGHLLYLPNITHQIPIKKPKKQLAKNYYYSCIEFSHLEAAYRTATLNSAFYIKK